MAIDYRQLAIPKPTSPGRVAASLARLKAKEDKRVYTYVSERDGHRCRVCGTYAGIVVHRHHLLGRRSTTPATVCCVCEDCHERLHVRIGGKTLKVSGNADARSRFGTLNGLTVQTRQPDGTWQAESGR